jgi:hypothetical protein
VSRNNFCACDSPTCESETGQNNQTEKVALVKFFRMNCFIQREMQDDVHRRVAEAVAFITHAHTTTDQYEKLV